MIKILLFYIWCFIKIFQNKPSRNMLITILLLGFLLFYISRIRKPIIHSSNQRMQQLAFSLIFPMIIFNSGVLQSLIQHLPTCYILCSAKKSVITLKISPGVEVVVEKFENVFFDEPISFMFRWLKVLYNVFLRITGCFYFRTNVSKAKALVKAIQKEINVIIMHGLGGSSESNHVVSMANMFLRKRCRVFCINARGVKGKLETTEFTHFGLTKDLHVLSQYVIENYEGSLFYIGFSQGANITTKFMGEYSNSRVMGAVSVCNPFDFLAIERKMKERYGFIRSLAYNFMLTVFKDHLKAVLKREFEGDDIREIVEEMINEKILNYKDIDAFLEDVSSEKYIEKIDKPILFINADDDPVIPVDVIPREKILKNTNAVLVTMQGGHLGFKSIFMTSTVENIVRDYFMQIQLTN